MLRFLLAVSLAAVLVSCDTSAPPANPATPPAKPAASPTPPAATPAATPTTPAAAPKPAAPDLNASIEKAKAAIPTGEEIKKAIAPLEEKAATAAPELAKIADSSITLEKVKSLIAGLKPEQLQGAADTLVAAIKEKLGSIGAVDLTKAGATQELIKGLKEKLKVVVDQLKAGGADVSKYTSFLN